MFKFRSFLSVNFLSALLLYYFTGPYFVWNLPAKRYLDILLQLIVGIVFIRRMKVLTKSDQLIVFLYVAVWVLYMFQLYNSGRNLFGLIQHVPICLLFSIFFCKRDFGEKVLNNYVNIYTFFILLSMSAWMLSSFVDLPSLGTLQHFGETDRQYSVFPFLVKENLSVDSFRFYGLFDEPGVVGTTGAVLLCILRFNFKDKRTWVLMLSGLLSMSFFFYSVVTIYSVLYLSLVKKNIPYTMLLIIIFSAFYYITSDNPIMSEVIWSRFEWDPETQQFVGDNRIDDLSVEYFDKIRGTSEYFWGMNNIEQYWRFAQGSSSYLNVIAMYGAVFFFAYCLFFVIFSFQYRYNVMSFVLFCFIFLLNMYQRTNIYSTLWVFLYAIFARGIMIEKQRV